MADDEERRIHDQEVGEEETDTASADNGAPRSAKSDREDREERQAEFEKFAEEQERDSEP